MSSFSEDILLAHGDVLMHAPFQSYDEFEAHQYYLDHRVLKGRKPAAVKAPVGKASSKSAGPVKKRFVSAPKKVIRKTAAQLAAERKAVLARVKELQARLAALKTVLAELVKQAKVRSGVKTNADGTSAATTSTTVQKTAQAKSSATYYEKNKAAILAKAKADAEAKDPTALEAQIQEVQAKIQKMREEFASAVN